MAQDRLLAGAVEAWVEQSSPPAPWLEERMLRAVREESAVLRRHARARWVSLPVASLVSFLVGIALVATLLEGAYALRTHSPAGASPAGLQAYRTVANVDYDSLYRAAHVADNPCYSHLVSQCRDRKLDTLQAAQRFLDDLRVSNTPTAIAPFNTILEGDLEVLIARTNSQLTLLNANPTVTSEGYDLVDLGAIAVAMGQVDCWPKSGLAGQVQPTDFGSRAGPPAPVCA